MTFVTPSEAKPVASDVAAHPISPPREQSRWRSVIAPWLVPAAALALVIAAWELGVSALAIPQYLLPPPSRVWNTFVDDPGYIVGHMFATGVAAAGGFLLALGVGTIVALLMAYSRSVERVLYPYMIVIKVVPVVAIAPLLAIWLGFGIAPKVVVAFLIAFFPIVVNLVLGFRSPPRDYLMLMRGLNASERDTFRKVRAPFALPLLFAACRVAAPTAVIGAIVAEFVGSDSGLGYVILLGKGYLQTDLIFLAIVASAVLGVVLFGMVVAVERRVLFWHESQD
jgi:NitT/TauT family transport system permease protein